MKGSLNHTIIKEVDEDELSDSYENQLSFAQQVDEVQETKPFCSMCLFQIEKKVFEFERSALAG